MISKLTRATHTADARKPCTWATACDANGTLVERTVARVAGLHVLPTFQSESDIEETTRIQLSSLL
jgi:hypothetical protein